METISVDQLRALGACAAAREWLQAEFGGAEVPLAEVLRAVAETPDGLSWVAWYLPHLPAPAKGAYDAEMEEAKAAYDAEMEAAKAAYDAATEEAKGAYDAAGEEAEDAYDAAVREAVRAAADALEADGPK